MIDAVSAPLPVSDRNPESRPATEHRPDPELVDRIAASAGLSEREAQRVIEDVLAFYRESMEHYVRRRHAELQLFGTRNAQAFALIADELQVRPVGAPNLTERQLRRIVYG